MKKNNRCIGIIVIMVLKQPCYVILSCDIYGKVINFLILNNETGHILYIISSLNIRKILNRIRIMFMGDHDPIRSFMSLLMNQKIQIY